MEANGNLELNITPDEITKLLKYFSNLVYDSKTACPLANDAMNKCELLYKLDFEIISLGNSQAEYSESYPIKILIPLYEVDKKLPKRQTLYESQIDEHSFKILLASARTARCRTRFAVPVILFKGKYVCRSATLSCGAEIYSRYEHFVKLLGYGRHGNLHDKLRNSDINLLMALNVNTIIDFMVENRKIKFGLKLTSSEKVDRENRYKQFVLTSLPYPGCEFFKNFLNNNLDGSNLFFDWTQPFIDASVYIPDDDEACFYLNIDWSKYRTWSLDEITKNYLKLILKHLQDNESGILIHCISGWDRTPLFISLIRISLWADGLLHQSLDVQQMLYLTLAYDWMLFSHNLKDRLAASEVILYYCFYFLKYIVDKEFSILPPPPRPRPPRPSCADDLPSDNGVYDPDGLLENQVPDLSDRCTDEATNEKPVALDSCADEASNGNSPDRKSAEGCRTSPIAMPGRRQRNDSNRSNESWTCVTGAGSIQSDFDLHSLNLNDQEPNSATASNDTNLENAGYIERKRRITKLRDQFMFCYSHAIGFDYKKV